MGLGIPPLEVKILLESNSLKSTILVRILAAIRWSQRPLAGAEAAAQLRSGLRGGSQAVGQRGALTNDDDDDDDDDNDME